jgi:fructose/tagatose bisphosphate aldolase
MLLNALQARAVIRTAVHRRFAILAINADSPAAITDALEAARQCESPVMIETSLWQLTGHSFGAGDPALGMARYLVQVALLADSDRFRNLPVLFHTDHIKGEGALPLLKTAIRGLRTGVEGCALSPSTISLDSSTLSEDENIESILQLCEASKQTGNPVTIEMEAGVDDGVTPPEIARRLLGGVEGRQPGFIHLWAPGVGTTHGLGDQSSFSVDAVHRHQALASEILGRPVGIALHGSSGLTEENLRAAVAAGVTKVNWSSESLLTRSQAAREFYTRHAAQLEKGHPDWKNAAMDNGVQSFVASKYLPQVASRICALGGAGQAADCLKAARSASESA